MCCFLRVDIALLCLQAMYNEFSTANIQIDKDFSAKLSGYGCVGHVPKEEISSSSSVRALTCSFTLKYPSRVYYISLIFSII